LDSVKEWTTEVKSVKRLNVGKIVWVRREEKRRRNSGRMGYMYEQSIWGNYSSGIGSSSVSREEEDDLPVRAATTW
jgi:hypothetical protein